MPFDHFIVPGGVIVVSHACGSFGRPGNHGNDRAWGKADVRAQETVPASIGLAKLGINSRHHSGNGQMWVSSRAGSPISGNDRNARSCGKHFCIAKVMMVEEIGAGYGRYYERRRKSGA